MKKDPIRWKATQERVRALSALTSDNPQAFYSEDFLSEQRAIVHRMIASSEQFSDKWQA